MLQPLKFEKASVIDLAAARIRDLIFDGSLQPGQPVTEKELSESWKISRPTAKMALGDIIRLGLMTQRPNHSARVKIFTPEDVLALETARRVTEAAATAVFLPSVVNFPTVLQRDRHLHLDTLGHERGDTAASRRAIREHEVGFHAALIKLIDKAPLSDIHATYADVMLASGHQLDVAYEPQQLLADHIDLLDLAERTVHGADPEQFEIRMYAHIGELTVQASQQFDLGRV